MSRQYWSDLEVKTMLGIFIEKRILSLLDGKKYRKNDVLEVVVTELGERNFERTAQQVRQKWTSLKADYKKAEKDNGKSGFNRTTCPFYDELVELLGDRPSVTSLQHGVQSLGEREQLQPYLENEMVTNSDEEDTPADFDAQVESMETDHDHFLAQLMYDSGGDTAATLTASSSGSEAAIENPESQTSTSSQVPKPPTAQPSTLPASQPSASSSSQNSDSSDSQATQNNKPAASSKRKNNGQKGSYAKAMKSHADDIRAVASQTTEAFIKYMKESSAVEGEAQRKHDKEMVQESGRQLKELSRDLCTSLKTSIENVSAWLFPRRSGPYSPAQPMPNSYIPSPFYQAAPNSPFPMDSSMSPSGRESHIFPSSAPINIPQNTEHLNISSTASPPSFPRSDSSSSAPVHSPLSPLLIEPATPRKTLPATAFSRSSTDSPTPNFDQTQSPFRPQDVRPPNPRVLRIISEPNRPASVPPSNSFKVAPFKVTSAKSQTSNATSNLDDIIKPRPRSISVSSCRSSPPIEKDCSLFKPNSVKSKIPLSISPPETTSLDIERIEASVRPQSARIPETVQISSFPTTSGTSGNPPTITSVPNAAPGTKKTLGAVLSIKGKKFILTRPLVKVEPKNV